MYLHHLTMSLHVANNLRNQKILLHFPLAGKCLMRKNQQLVTHHLTFLSRFRAQPSAALPVPPSPSLCAGKLNMARIFPSGRPRLRNRSKAVNPCASAMDVSARDRTNSCTKDSSPRSHAACSALRPPGPGSGKIPGLLRSAKRPYTGEALLSEAGFEKVFRTQDWVHWGRLFCM